MKLIALTAVLLFVQLATLAQNPAKAFKALDAGDYEAAKATFEELLILDQNDVAANYGMSRLHGISAAGMKDKEKALEYLVIAEAGFPSDEKERSRLAKAGVTSADLITRRKNIESSFLADAKDENTVAAYDAFMRRFPDSKSITAATNYRNQVAYENAVADGSVKALDDFIAAYPKSYEATKAIPQRDQLAADVALEANTEPAYRHFLDHYPEAKQAPMVAQRLNAVAFENAKEKGTSAAMRDYIAEFPESIFLQQAKEKLDWLESQGK